VASRGPGGALNMAGLAQATTILMVLFTLGAGLITTGMVFGKTRQGFQRCVRINFGILMGVVVLHVLLALPPVSRILFGRILGLPPEIETPPF